MHFLIWGSWFPNDSCEQSIKVLLKACHMLIFEGVSVWEIIRAVKWAAPYWVISCGYYLTIGTV